MSRYRLPALCLVAAVTLFRLWFLATGAWELSPEEAQYWDWSRRLDWSYYSKGPGIAYLVALATRLGGDSALAIRSPAVLMGALLALLAFALARETTGSERAAFWSVVILTAMPLYAAGGLLMTTDTPLVLCWAVAVYAVGRAAGGSRGTAWWHAAGAALAAGLLTKYTILLLVGCLAGFLLTHPRRPALLRGRGPWIVAAWGAAGATPILRWNWQHDWVSFRHVIGQATGGSSPWWQSAGEFLGVQAGVVSPLLLAGMVAGVLHAARRGLRARQPGPLLLFWTSGGPLLFFLLWSARAKIQGNWPAPAYLTAAIAATAWARGHLEDADRRAARGRKALLAVGVASIILAVALQALALAPAPARALGTALADLGQAPAFSATGPHGRGAIGPRAGRLLRRAGWLLSEGIDPCKRLCGWRELAARVSATQAAMRGGSGSAVRADDLPFIVSDRYQLASLLAFYVEGRPRTYTADLGGRLTQYDVWGGLDAQRGRNGIFVTYGYQPLPDAVGRAFRRVEVEPRVVVMADSRLLHGFFIVRGFDFLGFPPPPGRTRY